MTSTLFGIKKKKSQKSDFFSRNFIGQKRVELYIQSDEGKKLPSKKLYGAKLSFRIEG